MVKLGLSLFILASICLLSFLLNPDGFYSINLFKGEPEYILFDFIMILTLSWAIIESSIFITKHLERVLPWTKHPVLRFIVQMLSIIVSVAILFIIQDQIYTFIFYDETLSRQEYLGVLQFIVVTTVISLFVTTIHTGLFLLSRWKQSISEAAKLEIKAMELKEIAMQAELNSLKFQLDPHFMFNNFSTLSELITEDPGTANTFLENLSRVYRYMIQNLKKDFISLEEEIRFVQAYAYLIKIRHSENVIIKIDVEKESMNLYIPPISVQLLIENAIKHNIATNEQPLIIVITTKNNTLSVKNNLQKIRNPFPSTGIGLKNIADRYKLLAVKDVPVIEESDKEFKVTLALINLK